MRRKECPRCHGTKKIRRVTHPFGKHSRARTVDSTCPGCFGAGWI